MKEGSIVLYCRCGGVMEARIVPVDQTSDLEAIFWRVHAGDEHGPATRQEAREARRRDDRERKWLTIEMT